MIIIYFLLISNVFGKELFCKRIIQRNGNFTDYFGYSVQLRVNQNDGGRVLVGAPRANSTYEELQDINEPGAIYSCNLKSECEQYFINANVSSVLNTKPGYKYIQYNEGSWLGASIDGSDNLDEILVACAPRWINNIFHKSNIYLQNGICYVLQDARNIRSMGSLLIPLRNTDKSYYTINSNMSKNNYNFGEAGMSIHYMQDQQVLIGAPGIMEWAGAVAVSKFPYQDEEVEVTNNIRNIDEYSYLGYTVSSGKFLKGKEDRWFVAGAPRSNDVQGQIIVFEMDSKTYQTSNHSDKLIHYVANGAQMGEYFGAALTVSDVTGDGIDDIIVGSPMCSSESEEEIGCVYQIIANGQGVFSQSSNMTIPKMKAHSRFGSTLASLGDINMDGFNDIAVGAPYANDGEGLVVIMYGSSEGIVRKHYIIKPDPYMKGFGISISKGLDIDDNKINDFAIGAYESGHVVIFLTKYEIKMKPQLLTSVKRFNISTRTIEAKACLEYTDSKAPYELKFQRTIYFNDDRYAFDDQTTMKTIESYVKRGDSYCEKFLLLSQDNVQHHRNSLYIKMNYSLTDSECGDKPIFVEDGQRIAILKFDDGCQKSAVCKPNLALTTRFENITHSHIKLYTEITNSGDPAFGCELMLKSPKHVKIVYNGATCLKELNFPDYIICILAADPLNTNQKRTVGVDLYIDIEKVDFEKPLIFHLNVSSSGQDTDLSNNVLKPHYNLDRVEDIQFIRIANPSNLTIKKEYIDDLIHIDHTVKLINKAENPVDKIYLRLIIPEEYIMNVSYQMIIYKKPNMKESSIDTNKQCNKKIIEYYIQDENNLTRRKRRIYEETGLSSRSIIKDEYLLHWDEKRSCIEIICQLADYQLYKNGYMLVNITMRINDTQLVTDSGGIETLTSITSHEGIEKMFNIITRVGIEPDPPVFLSAGIVSAIGVSIALVIILIILFIVWKCGVFKKKQWEKVELIPANERAPKRKAEIRPEWSDDE